MALSDLVLRARVGVELMRDPRVSFFDIGVVSSDGAIVLTGDADTPEECTAAEEVTRGVPGVREVHNEMTCGVGQRADTADMVVQRLLGKLDEEFEALPDERALTQAGYLEWALWMICKFRLPDTVASEKPDDVVADATEQALTRVAGHVGAPKGLVALSMLRLAAEIAASPLRDAPEASTVALVPTRSAAGDRQAA